MKYQQPFGVLDPNASYEDGNRVTGTKGSIPPAAAIEQPMRELAHLIAYSGQVPSDVDMEQVRKAIELIIAAQSGGGDVAQYILMTQARARLPIFPEIDSADGRMNVSSPAAGTILVPPAVSFQHRGIYPVSTSDYPEVDRTLETVANKTYHLRWAYGSGFSLINVADPAYNPSSLAETDPAFDSAYDDMLIARVVTNSSNVATITNLANKNRLSTFYEKATYELGGSGNARGPDTAPILAVNWARVPSISWREFKVGPSTAYQVDGITNVFFDATRYTARPQVVGFYTNTAGTDIGTIDGAYKVELFA